MAELYDASDEMKPDNVQAANDALALMGVKLTPMAEMYADLHAAYTDLLAEHAAVCLAGQAVFDAWDCGDGPWLDEAFLALDEALP